MPPFTLRRTAALHDLIEWQNALFDRTATIQQDQSIFNRTKANPRFPRAVAQRACVIGYLAYNGPRCKELEIREILGGNEMSWQALANWLHLSPETIWNIYAEKDNDKALSGAIQLLKESLK